MERLEREIEAATGRLIAAGATDGRPASTP
jgi:hypothetical protein